MGGLEALRAWLRARLFLTNYRPVALQEHAVFQGAVYEKVRKKILRGEFFLVPFLSVCLWVLFVCLSVYLFQVLEGGGLEAAGRRIVG